MRVHLNVIKLVLVAVALTSCVTVDNKPSQALLDHARGVDRGDAIARSTVIVSGDGGRLMPNVFCNGIVLAPRLVLTAAHCFEHRMIPYTIQGGEYWKQALRAERTGHPKAAVYANITTFYFPPKFEENHAIYDIAIARLDRDLPDFLMPATLVGPQLALRDPGYVKNGADPASSNPKATIVSGSDLIAGTYSPFESYPEYPSIFAKLPVEYLFTSVEAHWMGLTPKNNGIFQKGYSGSGVYVMFDGRPYLIGVVIRQSHEDGHEGLVATDVKQLREWINSVQSTKI